jgi:lysophospholipase L1-like esterase
MSSWGRHAGRAGIVMVSALVVATGLIGATRSHARGTTRVAAATAPAAPAPSPTVTSTTVATAAAAPLTTRVTAPVPPRPRASAVQPATTAAPLTAPTVAPRVTVDQLVFDGQSLNNEPRFGHPYPEQLMARLHDHVQLGPVVAVNGTSYAQRSYDAAQRVDPHFGAAERSLFLDLAGQSDLSAGMPAERVLAAAETYARARRKAGARLAAVFTVPPSTWFSKSEDQQRVAYNQLLRLNTHHVFDAVIDIAARPEFADPSDPTYFYDGLHPTDNGARVIADTAEPVVRALLGY